MSVHILQTAISFVYYLPWFLIICISITDGTSVLNTKEDSISWAKDVKVLWDN